MDGIIFKQTADQFEDVFIEKTKEATTYEEAYKLAEEDHKKRFGCYRYSSYNSFRVIKNRKRK